MGNRAVITTEKDMAREDLGSLSTFLRSSRAAPMGILIVGVTFSSFSFISRSSYWM